MPLDAGVRYRHRLRGKLIYPPQLAKWLGQMRFFRFSGSFDRSDSFYRRYIHPRRNPLKAETKGPPTALGDITGEAGRETQTKIPADPRLKRRPYASEIIQKRLGIAP